MSIQGRDQFAPIKRTMKSILIHLIQLGIPIHIIEIHTDVSRVLLRKILTNSYEISPTVKDLNKLLKYYMELTRLFEQKEHCNAA